MEAHTKQAPKPLWRESLGRVLRLRRTDLGLTLSQVSVRSGVSSQYLSEIERGLKDPSSEVIEAISMVLGLALPQVLVLAAGEMQRDDRVVLSSRFAAEIARSRSPQATGQAQLSLVA